MFWLLSKFLLFLQVAITVYAEFDYTKIDYCTEDMKCNAKNNTSKEEMLENSGCNCKTNHTIREVTIDSDAFREIMRDRHNELRDMMVSGKDKNITSGAGIVNVLNYDFELEHLARCWMTGPYGPNGQHYHDKCRKTKTFEEQAGQNLAWKSESGFVEKKEKFNEAVQMWYDEVKDVGTEGKIIDKFGPIPEKVIGHFTQVMWGKATHLGCARGCKNPMGGETDARNCFVICNYSGKNEKMNVLGEPVYERTNKTCETECKCCTDKRFGHLCGEIEPIPKTPLPELPKGDEQESTLPPGSGFGPGSAAGNASGKEQDEYYDYFYQNDENDDGQVDSTTSTATSHFFQHKAMGVAVNIVILIFLLD